MKETMDVAAATDFFFQVATGIPVEQAAASCIGVNIAHLAALRELLAKGEEALRWLEPLVAGVPGAVMEPAKRPPTVELPTATAGERVSPDTNLRRLLEGLPDYRDLRHIADELKRQIEPEAAVPRAGSRGNALLWVLHQFGRKEGLTTEELAYAFCCMGIFADSDVDAARKVSWELSELRRKGWPVERSDARRWRLILRGRGK